MGTKMDKYVKALTGQGLLPPEMLRENVRTMRNLEETFQKDFNKMKVALMRKDMSLVETAIGKMESTIDKAKALVESMKVVAE